MELGNRYSVGLTTPKETRLVPADVITRKYIDIITNYGWQCGDSKNWHPDDLIYIVEGKDTLGFWIPIGGMFWELEHLHRRARVSLVIEIKWRQKGHFYTIWPVVKAEARRLKLHTMMFEVSESNESMRSCLGRIDDIERVGCIQEFVRSPTGNYYDQIIYQWVDPGKEVKQIGS